MEAKNIFKQHVQQGTYQWAQKPEEAKSGVPEQILLNCQSLHTLKVSNATDIHLPQIFIPHVHSKDFLLSFPSFTGKE